MMAKAWKDVIASEGYQTLPPEEQAKAQQQYFDEVVAPRVPDGNVEGARTQFFEQYPLATQVSAPQGSASGEYLPDGGYHVSMSHGVTPSPALENEQAPNANEQPSFVGRLGRQAGLTARYGLEGATAIPNMLWNGPAGVINWASGKELVPLADASSTADALGLPSPENTQERIVGDAASLMAGVSPLALVGRTAKAATGATKAVMEGISSNLGQQVASSAASGGAGGAVREAGGTPGMQAAASFVGGFAGPKTMASTANRSAKQAAEKSVPTVESLKSQAAELYDDAERLGVTASQQQTQGLAQDMRAIAQQEGLISPTGRVSEAYPKAREALRMLDDYGQGTMNVPQMQTVRKVLADAAGSPDSAERRIASIMLSRFDDFTSPLAPQLGEARMLYARALRGNQLETLRELAGSRAGQFTGSGYENALRTEYRKLNNRIIEGKERGWTPDQQEAIRRVAEGNLLANSLRQVGKIAPTGVVSMGLGGGLPYMIGNSIGGPALGSILGASSMGSGLLARDAATRLGIKNAMLAELLARSGGRVAYQPTAPNRWAQMLGAALGGQQAMQPN